MQLLALAATRTGRFVRVYERPRSGFQFSPIISNGLSGHLPGHRSFYHFPPSLRLPRPPSLAAPSPFLGFSRLLFQSPTWKDLSSTPTSRGSPITSCRYYRGEEEVSRKKKESSRKAARRSGDSISGIYGRIARACMRISSRRDVGSTSFFLHAWPYRGSHPLPVFRSSRTRECVRTIAAAIGYTLAPD